MSNFENLYKFVQEEAETLLKDIEDELRDEVVLSGMDVTEFLDEHVFSHVDNLFISTDLHDYAHILDQSDNVETDTGLWEGLEPIKAVQSMAFFTFRTDLTESLNEQVKSLLEDEEQDITEEISNLEERKDELEEEEYELDEDDFEDSEEYEERADAVTEELESLVSFIDEKLEELNNVEEALKQL